MFLGNFCFIENILICGMLAVAKKAFLFSLETA